MTNDEYVRTYLNLIERFTNGELTAREFSNRYIDIYLDDDKAPNEEVFRILDYLFAEADAYCEPELRDEVRGSIDEEQLTEAAVKTAEKLRDTR
ncbi:colicin immunity domain-containing protein [Haloarcula sp. S1CR25-12]|uniref:Colicin immunity domain-containing protein n=1 Tax=Haloarcula saliterrae TaxID=2950534 RepID=A0ABU2FEY3_9EURY|nr:colicin immunity domain-containing protein [Haloarcula sp. S1CR25-12]MDS0260817.1 colicin immunity domain-containing protein [Haloarcula sp. S1CR25-12]